MQCTLAAAYTPCEYSPLTRRNPPMPPPLLHSIPTHTTSNIKQHHTLHARVADIINCSRVLCIQWSRTRLWTPFEHTHTNTNVTNVWQCSSDVVVVVDIFQVYQRLRTARLCNFSHHLHNVWASQCIGTHRLRRSHTRIRSQTPFTCMMVDVYTIICARCGIFLALRRQSARFRSGAKASCTFDYA